MRDGFITVAAGTPKLRVADCPYNAEQSLILIRKAAEEGVKLLVLPELGLTGYTCGDLFLQPTLLRGAEDALGLLLEQTKELELVWLAGLPIRVGGALYNCAAVCQRGKILGVVPKTNIPNYGEFYEKRHFAPGPTEPAPIQLCGQQPLLGTNLLFQCTDMPEFVLGAEICEDLWVPRPPTDHLAAAGATVLCNLSASNETASKADYRRQLVMGQSARLTAAYVYASSGDGESTSDLVFSGHDLIAENGIILAEQRFTCGLVLTQIDVLRLHQERCRTLRFAAAQPEHCETVLFHWTLEETRLTRPVSSSPFVPLDPVQRRDACEEVLTLASLGLQHRVEHTHAKTAVIGLSGGLDSTLALLIAIRAFDRLGRDRKDILAVTMPCFGTTARTRSNAEILAEHCGCSFRSISIADSVRCHFRDIGQDMDCHDVTFENAPARERTQGLMDLANMTGGLVVGTGDLSELALGWATYNGDHMSMYSVNASIPKTLVRHLVAHTARETGDEGLRAVLNDILDTPVSPELLPADGEQIAQKTEDLVGPYELHDFFLYYALRWTCSPGKIFRLAQYTLGQVYDRETILKWLRIFYRRFFTQQFKRNCIPDGPKVGTVSLSPRGDWRMPSDAQWTLWEAELNKLQ